MTFEKGSTPLTEAFVTTIQKGGVGVLANHFYFVARRSIADMALIVLGGGSISERRSRAGSNSINHIAVDEAYGEFTNAKEANNQNYKEK